ncbi:helix-turn-helix transcriptional regulator [Fulvivirga kasyanovii]|uniref:Helix-turn-helix domain-containing protein n=1 Tax=Fulvivirga kasyanovii TaxID=396812 RepID=A0ABW9RYA1_9BACT|nr:helix-turn-helix domain-containing protein [Fulvivirga kasyanovii]MTI28249.1 helix-turn-helix domain-containing protein [Fulvivirga kasyanovii]
MDFQTHRLDINAKNFNGIIVDTIPHENPYDFTKIHRHDYYELLFFTEGAGGEQIIDFVKHKTLQKAVYIVSPGQVHLLKRKPGENGFSIQFTKEFLQLNLPSAHQEWISALQGQTEITISAEKYDRLYDLVQRLLIVFEERTEMSFHKVVSYFSLVLIEVYEIANEKPDFRKDTPLAMQFADLVQKHYRTHRTVQHYADMMGISASKLNAEIGNSLGKSPKQIIQEHLLIEIKRLLTVNELSHKEVSFELNFDSQNSYNRFIRVSTGKTPSALKQELIEIHK